MLKKYIHITLLGLFWFESLFAQLSLRHVLTEGEVSLIEDSLSLQPVSEPATSPVSGVYAVGRIPVEQTVSPSGAMVYSIPIGVASGWNLTPSIALTYNSQGGNGIAGYGWEITGVPSITTRNHNYYYDSAIQPASYYSLSVKYSLDGMPLVQSESVVDGYEMSTARGNVQVRAVRATGSQSVRYFEVLFPDGTMGRFGFEGNTSRNRTYPLTLLTDRNGNEITFSYTLTSGVYYLDSVNYGASGSSEIRFTYSQRSDTGAPGYSALASVQYPVKLLTRVESLDGGEELYRYTLTHKTSAGVSLLSSIGMSSGDTSVPPVRFAYGVDTEPRLVQTFTRVYGNTLQNYLYDSPVYKRGRLYPGNAGDGIIMYPNKPTYTELDIKWIGLHRYYKYGSGYSSNDMLMIAPRALESADTRIITVGDGFQIAEAVDVDGDGTDEVVKVNFSGSTATSTTYQITIYKFDASGSMSTRGFTVTVSDSNSNSGYYNPAQSHFRFGSFRGDGKAQLVIATRQSSVFALVDLNSGAKLGEQDGLFTVDEDFEQLTIVADFDGDSKVELCYIDESSLKSYKVMGVTGTSFYTYSSYSGVTKSLVTSCTGCNIGSASSTGRARLYVGDINADGYPDILSAPDISHGSTGACNQWHWFISTGQSFQHHSQNLRTRTPSTEILLMDVDKDNYPDIVQLDNNTLYLVRNIDGTAFAAAGTSNPYCTVYTGSHLLLCAATRLGEKVELMTVKYNIVHGYRYNTDQSHNRRITELDDGALNKTVTTYGSVDGNDGSYFCDFTRTYETSSGFKRDVMPLPLVKMVTAFSMGERVSSVAYTYYDSVVNTRGLGFCGFGGIRTREIVSGNVAYTKADPEKMGVPMETLLYAKDDDTPNKVISYTFDSHSSTYGKLDPRMSSSVATDNLTGIVSRITYEYDAYGYPIKEVSSRRIGNGQPHTDTLKRSYFHKLYPTNYILGSVTAQSVRKERDGSSLLGWMDRTQTEFDTLMRPISVKTYSGRFGVRQRIIHGPIQPITEFPGDSLFLPDPLPVLYERIPVDSTAIVSEIRYTYDTYGNVVSERSAPYGKTVFTGGGRTFSGRHIVEEWDALEHSTFYGNYDAFNNPGIVSREFDNGSGGFYHLTDTLSYDGLGRVTRRVTPDGSVETIERKWGGKGLYTEEKTRSGSPETIVHYDALGREIRRGERRFNGDWVYVDTHYDDRGLIDRVSLPFKGDTTSNWNLYVYDYYDRLTFSQTPAGRMTWYAYNGSEVTVTDEGIATTRITDPSGNLVSATDTCGTISYIYRDDGQLYKVTSPEGVVTTVSYDRYGRRKKLYDPGAGTHTYSYVYGDDGSHTELSTSPTGTVSSHYDRYGRLSERVLDGTDSTVYAYSERTGLLTSVTSTNGTGTVFSYDSIHRLAGITESGVDGRWFEKSVTYGDGSNIATVSYTTEEGLITTELYSYTNGHLTSIHTSEGINVFTLSSENDMGMPTRVLTQGVQRDYSYTTSGFPSSRSMNYWYGGYHTYQFDGSTGNLLQRRDLRNDWTESFSYDGMNRLVAAGAGRTASYADNGNITFKWDVGAMSYDDADNPYKLTSWTSSGGIPLTDTREITYNGAARPTSITYENKVASFVYNGENDRVKMSVSDGADTLLVRYYLGGRYERDETDSTTVRRLYLGGDAYSAPMVYIKENDGGWTAYNIGRDYLGSITEILRADGSTVAQYMYDPWGNVADSETRTALTSGLFLGRGFTGHEHLPWFGLVNMNARLYDPRFGRFLYPDPYIQAPGFTQGLNRYSYCLNNPLKYTDESGEFIISGTVAIVMTTVAVIAGTTAGVFKGAQIADTRGLTGNERTWTIIGGGIIGGIAGFAGAVAGAAASASLTIGGFVGGAIVGGSAGAASGAVNGFGMTLLGGGSIFDAINQGLYQGTVSSLSGAVIGGLVQGTASALQGKSFWDGRLPKGGYSNHKTKAQILRENQAAHRNAVEKYIQQMQQEGASNIEKEVSIEVDGKWIKMDIAARVEDSPVLVEVKSSPTASFTKNQRIVYPMILENKVPITPFGHNAQSVFYQPEMMGTVNYTFIIVKF